MKCLPTPLQILTEQTVGNTDCGFAYFTGVWWTWTSVWWSSDRITFLDFMHQLLRCKTYQYCFLQWNRRLFWIRREMCTDQAPFTSKNSPKQLTNVGGFWSKGQGDGLFHWRKCYYGLWTHILARSNSLKLNVMDLFLRTCSFWLLEMLTDGLEWVICGKLWCFYQCLDSHSDGTHSLYDDLLLSKWCNATFLQIWWRRKTHLHLGWHEGE